MTGGRGFRWTRGRKFSAVVLVAASLALAGIAGFAGEDGLVYYRTPTEVAHSATRTDPVRVGGLVLVGSVEQSDTESTLLLSDGATEITVVYPGRLPAVVQEGQGAVVEGTWRPDGVLQGEELLLRHSNEYRAPVEEAP